MTVSISFHEEGRNAGHKDRNFSDRSEADAWVLEKFGIGLSWSEGPMKHLIEASIPSTKEPLLIALLLDDQSGLAIGWSMVSNWENEELAEVSRSVEEFADWESNDDAIESLWTAIDLKKEANDIKSKRGVVAGIIDWIENGEPYIPGFGGG